MSVEILDAAGRVIRTFTGGRAGADSAAGRPAAADRRPALGRRRRARRRRPRHDPSAERVRDPAAPRRAARPAGNAGLNRFTWDLRYAGATIFACMVIWSAAPDHGPLALPGQYRVRVTADGVSETRPSPCAPTRASWA